MVSLPDDQMAHGGSSHPGSGPYVGPKGLYGILQLETQGTEACLKTSTCWLVKYEPVHITYICIYTYTSYTLIYSVYIYIIYIYVPLCTYSIACVDGIYILVGYPKIPIISLQPPHPIAGSPGLLRRRSPPPVAHGPCLSGPGQWPVPCRKIWLWAMDWTWSMDRMDMENQQNMDLSVITW